jgi:hypothetical protein
MFSYINRGTCWLVVSLYPSKKHGRSIHIFDGSAVYPLVSSLLRSDLSTLGAYNLGGTNATGQVPEMTGNFGLIDKDTPEDAYTHTSLDDGSEWDLVFSDEFNTDGRSFYPGDDPYWEAADLHYW